jgi:hypothetical protein
MLEQFKSELDSQQLYRISRGSDQLLELLKDGSSESPISNNQSGITNDSAPTTPSGVGPESSMAEGVPTSGGTH